MPTLQNTLVTPYDHLLSRPLRVPLTTAQLTGRACVFCGASGCPLSHIGWLRVPLGDSYTSSPVNACTTLLEEGAR